MQLMDTEIKIISVLSESKLSEVSKGKLSDISYGNFQQKKKLALYLFIPLLIMVLILLNFSALRNQFSYCPDQELYTFLQKLPADTVFASHPDDADCIALYSKKMPFLTSETAIPSSNCIILSFDFPALPGLACKERTAASTSSL